MRVRESPELMTTCHIPLSVTCSYQLFYPNYIHVHSFFKVLVVFFHFFVTFVKLNVTENIVFSLSC